MKPAIVILAAGRPFGGKTPSDQRLIDRHRNVLEWQIEALSSLGGDVEIVTGYEARHLEGSGYHQVVNANWESTGSAYSLFLAKISADRDLVFCYSDILFRSDIVHQLKETDDAVSVAIDSTRRSKRRASREVYRGPPDSGFARAGRSDSLGKDVSDLVGLVRVPARLVPRLLALRSVVEEKLSQAHVGELLQLLLESGVPLRAVDVAGNWSDLDDEASLARFLFGTKAETLARLAPRLKTASIQPQISFTVGQWRTRRQDLVAQVIGAFAGRLLAVRSSSLSEDGFSESNAGRFRSLLAIECNAAAVASAIEDVIASFDGDDGHQVLVQPMVHDIVASGVLITRTLGRGAPYYVVNFTLGGESDGITSGRSERAHIAHVHRDHIHFAPRQPINIRAVVEAVCEIEQLTELDTLDVEFAITSRGEICVLQVRPLVLDHDRSRQDDVNLAESLNEAHGEYLRISGPVPGALGRRSIFGVMPDWNPAEIIGTSPSPLSASLYRRLIMDETWARQRAEFGYRDMRPMPLQRSFAGHPYVDVRASINSFIPATLDDSIATRITEAAVDRLVRNPHWHDKIEFEVVPTCLDLDFARWNDRLFADAGLRPPEIKLVRDAYGAITHGAPAICEEAWSNCLDYAGMAQDPKTGDLLSDAAALLANCQAHGTPAFAHLARCGFVAMSLLRTAVSRGIISDSRLDAFLLSIQTVSHQFRADGAAVHSGAMPFDEFVAKYGHLRPGTYDIESLAYGDDVELFLRSAVQADEIAHHQELFTWTTHETDGWRRICDQELAWDIDIEDLTQFFRRSIEGREYSKFVFTRALSLALNKIVAWGASKGLSRRDLACLEMADLFDGVPRSSDTLIERIERNRRLWETATHIELPALIREPHELFAFVTTAVRPNFVTKKRISAQSVAVQMGLPPDVDLKNSIVLIERADPGFDWLFGRGIGALITAYGGANSHMAIRCAEFGIPAAIGVGMAEFLRLSRASVVELNCEAGRITVMK